MKKFRDLASRQQLTLLPRSIDEYVSEEDGVRLFDEVLELLDISAIEELYVGGGRPAYRPRVLIKIIGYGILRGMRSSRELSRATRENLRFIFLAQGEQPDFRTISEFRRKNHQFLADVLSQTVRIGLSEGLITLEQVAIDGTKIRGSAGKNSFKSLEHLEEQHEQLTKLIGQALIAGTAADEEEDATLDSDDDGDMYLPKTLQGKQERKERIAKAIEELSKSGAKKASMTDPECRFMKTQPAFNAQAAVDTDSGFCVGGYITSNVNDTQELEPSVAAVIENTEKPPNSVVADQGYNTYAAIVAVEEANIEVFVPMGEPKTRARELFTYHPDNDHFTCAGGRTLTRAGSYKNKTHYKTRSCRGCSFRPQCCPKDPEGSSRLIAMHKHHDVFERMSEKMRTSYGVQALRKRRCTIEPLFGTIKFARRLWQFTLRGIEKVSSLWKFELAMHNVAKLVSAMG